MRLFDLFFSPHRHSAAIAKERLKIVLAHERAGRNAPDFLPKLQKELIEVVARYVAIREDMIRVKKILYPTDFSSYSNQAYFHAVALAESPALLARREMERRFAPPAAAIAAQ